jgi:HAD superfamily hydrolase (TIGR01490 family)
MTQQQAKQGIAIFDLDETLTKKGTWGRFVLASIKRKPHKWLPFFASSLFSQAKYMLGKGPREHVKESMMRWTLSGRSHTDLMAMAEIFAQNEIENGLRDQARLVLQRHKDAGDRIIIATAAVDLIIEPIARRLGVDEVVCTKMAYHEDGTLAQKLGGENCYGAGKLKLVKEYLDGDPKYRRDHAHITMYSDSRSDLDILRWADVGIAVNPSPRLTKCAPEYGFAVQDWDRQDLGLK